MKNIPSFSEIMDILSEGSDEEIEGLLKTIETGPTIELDLLIKRIIGEKI